MKKVTDTIIFNSMFKDDATASKFSTLKVKDMAVPLSQLNDYVDMFRRKFKFPSVQMIADDVLNMQTLPIMYEFDMNLPISLYTWLTAIDGKIVAIVNMSLFPDEIKLNDKKELDAEPRTLFALLQAGSLLRRGYVNFDKLKNNATVIKLASRAYVALFMKVLDKLFAINLYAREAEEIKFMLTKFFLVNVLERDFKDVNDLNEYAYNMTETTVPKEFIFGSDKFDNFDKMYRSTIDGFINELVHIKNNKISGFSLRRLVNEWGNLYGSSTLLGLEHINYFLNMIATAELSTKMNKGYLISNTLGDTVTKLYNEMVRVLYV